MISVNGESGRYICLFSIVYDSIWSTLPEFHDSFTYSAVTSDVMTLAVCGLGNAGVNVNVKYVYCSS